jgi:hypothetical protein
VPGASPEGCPAGAIDRVSDVSFPQAINPAIKTRLFKTQNIFFIFMVIGSYFFIYQNP